MVRLWLLKAIVFFAVCLSSTMYFIVPHAVAASKEITVFAAASTTNALTEIASHYEAAGHGKVHMSFASSSTLAKQIEHGAPADIFLSADTKWMNYLEEKNLLEKNARSNLLGNSLVFIVPSSSAVSPFTVDPSLDLAGLLGEKGLLAVGDPTHVPVGVYSKEALEKLGLWTQVENRLAPAKDVRAGLALVAQGESPLGIVYSSDAGAFGSVKVVGEFPAKSHPEIVYPIAVVAKANIVAAQHFIGYLSGAEAREVWVKYGFFVQ